MEQAEEILNDTTENNTCDGTDSVFENSGVDDAAIDESAFATAEESTDANIDSPEI